MATCLGIMFLVTCVVLQGCEALEAGKHGAAETTKGKAGTTGVRTGRSEGYRGFPGPLPTKAPRSGNLVMSRSP